MVKVQVWGSLKPAIGGEDSVEVEGDTINDLLKTLSEQYPGMAEAVRRGVSVTVNGDSSNQVVAAPSSPVLHFGNARGKRFLLNGRVPGKAAVLSASGKSAAMKAPSAGVYVRKNGGRGLREAVVR